ncbi:unnamed protein product [Aphanomyces euteiches]
MDPFLYEFSLTSSPIELFAASYSDPYTADTFTYGTWLTYTYPLADDADIQGFIEVSEYSEEVKQQLKVLREFDSGDLHWKDYGDQVYVAKQNDHYYEIKLQGKLSEEQLQELLSHFGPAEPAK